MIIGMTLAVLLVITLFSILTGNSFIGGTAFSDIDVVGYVNGTSTEFIIEGETAIFFLDPTMGLVAVLIIVVSLIALAGFNVLATGLNSESVKIISIAIMYTAIWGFLTFLSLPLLNSIPIIGNLFYISLSILYVIGVIQKFGGGGGTE